MQQLPRTQNEHQYSLDSSSRPLNQQKSDRKLFEENKNKMDNVRKRNRGQKQNLDKLMSSLKVLSIYSNFYRMTKIAENWDLEGKLERLK